MRNFEQAGGWALERLDTPASLSATLAEAWTWMAARFERDGIDDPFAAAHVKAFFHDAAVASLGDERPALGLWRVAVGGRTAAIMASGFGGSTFSPMFTTYRAGEFESESPGEFLIYELCQVAADAGARAFDLGRGRETYKLSWTDGPVPLYDVRLGRTPRARAYFRAREAVSHVKRRIRHDDRLWGIAKRVRAVLGPRG